jgi:hypothetical protein
MDRSSYPTAKRRLGDPDDDAATIARLTPAERLEMVWQLTLQAWAFTGTVDGEPRLRRDVVRVIRGRR